MRDLCLMSKFSFNKKIKEFKLSHTLVKRDSSKSQLHLPLSHALSKHEIFAKAGHFRAEG